MSAQAGNMNASVGSKMCLGPFITGCTACCLWALRVSRNGEVESGARSGRTASQAASSEFRRTAASRLTVGTASQPRQSSISLAVRSSWASASISRAASGPLVRPRSNASRALRARSLSCAEGSSWITPAVSSQAFQPSVWAVSTLRNLPRARRWSSAVATGWSSRAPPPRQSHGRRLEHAAAALAAPWSSDVRLAFRQQAAPRS